MSQDINSLLLHVPPDQLPLGVVIVDHGSRRDESNELLLRIAASFANASGLSIVEPAHMELAEPTLKDAFDRCVKRGARTVVVFPYFLLPGRHWDEDIPRLAAEAAAHHPAIKTRVAKPFGSHPFMNRVIAERILECLSNSTNKPC